MLKGKEEWHNVKLVHLITVGVWTRSLVDVTNSTSYSMLQGNSHNILKAKEMSILCIYEVLKTPKLEPFLNISVKFKFQILMFNLKILTLNVF